MDVIKACRVCFATETHTPLFSLDENILIGFEEILGCKITINNSLPNYICKPCKTEIQRYADFKSRCCHAQHELNRKLNLGGQLTEDLMKEINENFQTKKLVVTKVHILCTGITHTDACYNDNSYDCSMKKIELNSLHEEIKNEYIEDVNECVEQEEEENINESVKQEENEEEDVNECKKEENKNEHENENLLKSETTKYDVEESIQMQKTPTENNTAKDICLDSTSRKRVAKKQIDDKKTKPNYKRSPLKKRRETSDVILEAKGTKANEIVNKDVKSYSKLKKDKTTSGARQITEQNLKKYNMQLRVLTKEEQIKNMLSRKDSDKYKLARLKCEICYKPYSAEKAFENHTALHTPSPQRPAECELCHLFLSRRTLRDHLGEHEKRLACRQCGEEVSRAQMKLHHDFHAGVMFECKECSKVYYRKSTYKSHLRAQHADVPCALCGLACCGPRGVRVHVRKAHQQEAREQCGGCKHYFRSQEAKQRHLRDSACTNDVTPCGWCGAGVGAGAGVLAAHIAAEHASAPSPHKELVCTECNSTFRLEATLIAHWWRVHNKSESQEAASSQKLKSVVCELCGAVLLSNRLRTHMRKHTGEKPHQCDVCRRRFRVVAALKSHMLVHSGEKPFRCAQCPKAYRQDAHLRLHIRTHTGEKPYKCELCQKAFACKGNRDEHARTVHEGLPPRRRGRGSGTHEKHTRVGGTGVSTSAPTKGAVTH